MKVFAQTLQELMETRLGDRAVREERTCQQRHDEELAAREFRSRYDDVWLPCLRVVCEGVRGSFHTAIRLTGAAGHGGEEFQHAVELTFRTIGAYRPRWVPPRDRFGGLGWMLQRVILGIRLGPPPVVRQQPEFVLRLGLRRGKVVAQAEFRAIGDRFRELGIVPLESTHKDWIEDAATVFVREVRATLASDYDGLA